MTREEAVNHLMNDWFQALGGQLCVDGDRKDAFLEAIGVAVTALKAAPAVDAVPVVRCGSGSAMMELKPCPFCGGKARGRRYRKYGHGDYDDTYFVECSNCGARGEPIEDCTPIPASFSEQFKKAADAWNRRIPHDT